MTSYWTIDDDETLIDFVRNHEALYNVKHKKYRRTQLKHNWWREIGSVLNKSATDCSKRWCYVRDYYIRRRGKACTGISGEAATRRASLLSFLDKLPSSQRSSITITNADDENSEDNSVKMENTHDTSDTQTPPDDTVVFENAPEDYLYDNKKDRAKSDKKRKHNSLAQEGLDNLANRSTSQKGLDENDLFFGSMAKIVKKLPPYEQVKLRLQIGSIVGNAELRHILNKPPSVRAVSPRPSTSNSDY